MGKSNTIISGMIWKFGERISAQVISFVVSIVLARMLAPEAYGLVTLVNIFIILANVFVADGFGNALIQKRDADELDFNSMFYASLGVSGCLYLLLYCTAPYIAQLYGNNELILIIRIFALKLPISAFSTIQHAYVSRHMMFRKFFFSTLFGTLISGIVGVGMAIKGFGVWALIAQYLTNTVIDCVVLLFTIPWKPKIEFSLGRVKHLMGYGWKVLATGLVSNFYGQLRSLVIGTLYTSSDLAYYNRGERFPGLITDNIDTTISSVLFPAISNYSSDIEQVKAMTRKAMRTSSYIIFPLMTGLAIVATPFVTLLLTEKWLPCVIFLRIYCFEKATSPFSTANLQAIKAIGRSDVLLKMEIIKKLFGIVLLLVVMKHGVLAIGYSCIITAIFCLLVNTIPNGKLIGYTFRQQIKDILPIIILCIGMGAPTVVVSNILISLNVPSMIVLIVDAFVGSLIYIGLSKIFKMEQFNYLLGKIKSAFGRKKTDCM